MREIPEGLNCNTEAVPSRLSALPDPAGHLGDEYDTPLLEAYTDGYWSEMIGTCRQLFHSTFKENPYYARALITGVTKVSKIRCFRI